MRHTVLHILIGVCLLWGLGGMTQAQVAHPAGPVSVGSSGGALARPGVEWATLNPAGLTGVLERRVYMTGSLPFGLSGLSSATLAYQHPLTTQTALGLSLSGQGMGGAYRQESLSLTAAHRAGLTDLALQGQVIQTGAEGLTSTYTPSLTLGGVARPTPGVRLAGVVYHLTHGRIASDLEGRLPTRFAAGGAVALSSRLWAMAQLDKDLVTPARVSLAAELALTDALTLRAGHTPGLARTGLGCDLHRGGWNLLYGVSWVPALGLTHALTVGLRLEARPRRVLPVTSPDTLGPGPAGPPVWQRESSGGVMPAPPSSTSPPSTPAAPAPLVPETEAPRPAAWPPRR